MRKWGFLPLLVLGAATVWRMSGLLATRRAAANGIGAAWPRQAALFFAALLLFTVTAHYFLYRAFHVLLPVGRTAVFLAPLFTLLAGTAAALPGRSRKIAAAALWATAACFICCLRLTYFQEWQYDADAKQLYTALAGYARRHRLESVSANWRYVAVLNYYRAQDGGGLVPPIGPGPAEVDSYPPAEDAYVVYYPWDQDFVAREGLELVYRSDMTGAAVAVRQGAGRDRPPCVRASVPSPSGRPASHTY